MTHEPPQPLRFSFDETKATQAAARFVSKHHGHLSHLMLMKLLYIADREALRRWGRPVSGGAYFSLPHGPVISPVLNLMKRVEGLEPSTLWAEHFTKMGHEMHLKKDPGHDALSAAELKLIDELFEQYSKLSKWGIRDLTHEFGEWHDPKGSSSPISVESILENVGKSPEEIAALGEEVRALSFVDSIIEK